MSGIYRHPYTDVPWLCYLFSLDLDVTAAEWNRCLITVMQQKQNNVKLCTEKAEMCKRDGCLDLGVESVTGSGPNCVFLQREGLCFENSSGLMKPHLKCCSLLRAQFKVLVNMYICMYLFIYFNLIYFSQIYFPQIEIIVSI